MLVLIFFFFSYDCFLGGGAIFEKKREGSKGGGRCGWHGTSKRRDSVVVVLWICGTYEGY